MAFSCGCEVKAGEPVSIETIRNHYKHTMEAIFFWELIFRRGADLASVKLKLNQLRVDLLNTIEEIFPELKEEER